MSLGSRIRRLCSAPTVPVSKAPVAHLFQPRRAKHPAMSSLGVLVSVVLTSRPSSITRVFLWRPIRSNISQLSGAGLGRVVGKPPTPARLGLGVPPGPPCPVASGRFRISDSPSRPTARSLLSCFEFDCSPHGHAPDAAVEAGSQTRRATRPGTRTA